MLTVNKNGFHVSRPDLLRILASRDITFYAFCMKILEKTATHFCYSSTHILQSDLTILTLFSILFLTEFP